MGRQFICCFLFFCLIYSVSPADNLFVSTTPICGNRIVEAGEECDGGSCCTTKCKFRDSRWLCRKSESECDIPDYCTGTSATCPQKVAPWGTVCREAEGDCDIVERCDGIRPTCPDDMVRDNQFLCSRSRMGLPCLADNYCDGQNKTCPGPSFKNGTLCREAQGVCDAPEYCDGTKPQCPKNVYANTSVICGFSKLGYDIRCEGNRPDCPEDVRLAPTLPKPTGGCGDGFVDVLEGEECEDFKTNRCCSTSCKWVTPGSVICRPRAGLCDLPEYCGVNGTCPTDLFSNSSVLCRPAVPKALCDVPEYCTGSSPTCPTDTVKANGTICRKGFFSCDLDEVCNGTSKVCPPDVVKPANTICRNAEASIWPCWLEERCNGINASCPVVRNVNCTN